MGYFLWILLVLSSTFNAFASEPHNTVANNFLKYHKITKTISSFDPVKHNDVTVGYLFHLSSGGYILMPASTSLTPIKAYSFERDFYNLPPAIQEFYIKELASYSKGIKDGIIPMSTPENTARWDFLLTYSSQKQIMAYTPDTYLLTTTWNQGVPYNKFLPEINGKKTLAGCVNIAIGQLMKYHKYPLRGTGIITHQYNNQTLKTVLHKNYNWDNIPDKLTATTPQHQIDETAWFIRDLAIANKTSFGINESGASINISSLIENFGFSNSIKHMKNTNTTVFFGTIKSEIDSLRPLLLSFPGHMTVADGYASDPTGKKIHVNMGWGGSYNDYYFLDSVVTTGSYTFQPNLEIYYDIKPCSAADCHLDMEPTDSKNGNSITGKFDYSLDIDVYPLYLKGDTTISGNRGYINQSFYISVYDKNNILIAQSDNTITLDNLSVGKYLVKVSLCNDESRCYFNTNPQYSSYTVTISTLPLTNEELQSANNVDLPPVIETDFSNISINATHTPTYHIFVNAYDVNNDNLTLTASTDQPYVLYASFDGNLLTLTAGQGSGVVTITVTALAGDKSVSKTFTAFVLNETVGFGKQFTVTGKFLDNSSTLYKHKVVLDDMCTISGYRGYSNQAFFTFVYNSNDTKITNASNTEFTMTFSKGIYYIGASLRSAQSGSYSYYNYDPNFADYSISVKCPNADDSVQNIAALLGISTQPPPSFTINLNQGWNFISLPMQPDNASISKVLNDVVNKVRIVWGYDNQAKQWQRFKPVENTNSIGTMHAGKGYWINLTEAGSLINIGQSLVQQFNNLTTGWNLIGWSGEDNANITVLTQQLNDWDYIWGWYDGVWSFKSANPQIQNTVNLPELTTLHKGRAYWIKK